jgi:hypothetical protein
MGDMIGRLRAFRTNENVLLAIDTLVHSKSAFLSIFLMTYMIRASAEQTPTEFIVYRLLSFALMAILSVALLGFLKRYTLMAWRAGMLFAIIQVLVIMFFDVGSDWFPIVLAGITGLESILYWRPSMFFVVTEVRNDRRLRFQSLRLIFTQIAKILMPVVMGLMITDSGYEQAAIVILAISVMQFLLSILFRPSRDLPVSRHKLRTVFSKIANNSLLRRIMYVQFLRGALVSGSGFLIIPPLLVYQNTGSDLDLGVYASLAAVMAIAMTLIYRELKRRKIGSRLFLSIVAPGTIILPLVLWLAPSAIVAIILYVFTVACFEGFLNMFLTMKIQNWLKKRMGDYAYTLEVEAVSEVFLCTGRVISLTLLLVVLMAGGMDSLVLYAIISSMMIVPIVFLSTRALKRRHA